MQLKRYEDGHPYVVITRQWWDSDARWEKKQKKARAFINDLTRFNMEFFGIATFPQGE